PSAYRTVPRVEPQGPQPMVPSRKRASQQHGVPLASAAAGEPAKVGDTSARATTAAKSGFMLDYDSCRAAGTAAIPKAAGAPIATTVATGTVSPAGSGCDGRGEVVTFGEGGIRNGEGSE